MTDHDRYYQQLDEYNRAWDPKNHLEVNPWERFWVARYNWLMSNGYILRPRYNPDWVPSWKDTTKWWLKCEDGASIPAARSQLMDATRTSDGKQVALKRVFKSKHPFETDIGLFLSNDMLAPDPKNHCIPTYEVWQDPEYDDIYILVMPFLRPCSNPRFETFGESVEFFRQAFQGIQFMHSHHVAHRDCSAHNIMMESERLYPNGYHPVALRFNRTFRGRAKHYTRTERPPRYFLIDFGLSRRYDPKAGAPLEYPIRGGDKSVPEFEGDGYDKPSNPFHTDIYYLGNMIKEDFMDAAYGFDFMSSLVSDMIQDDPSKRPTIDEVVARFDPIYRSLSTKILRSRVVSREEEDAKRWIRNWVHFFRRLRFVVQRIPPVPRLDPVARSVQSKGHA